MPRAFPHIGRRSYIPAIRGGRCPTTVAPRTSWRQTVRASDLATDVAEVYVDGTVGAIADGNFVFDFTDRNGNLLTQVTVPVGGGTPPDIAGLSQAIVDAIDAKGAPGQPLEDALDSTLVDGADFGVQWRPGANITMSVNAEPVASVVLNHTAEIHTNDILSARNTFPVNVFREADPYLRVTEAWPAGSTASLEALGVLNSTVITDAPIDALGAQVTSTRTTLSATDMLEQAWNPVLYIDLGETAAPATGSLEIVVQISPVLAPERL